MNDLIETLRKQAVEIAKAGHNGWGNTMGDAANRIADLERKNAMLVDAAKAADDAIVTQISGDYNDVIHAAHLKCEAALSSISADTEKWLQAEIVKRLGEPYAWMREVTIQESWDRKIPSGPIFDLRNPKETGFYFSLREIKEFEPLYRLPEPLATPEERIKEVRI